ncbi:hypothetical protein IIA95_04225, partial [Patescibacteria group bacterium]|nr:hypothetical protein [Patescibacteria group bacterium]
MTKTIRQIHSKKILIPFILILFLILPSLVLTLSLVPKIVHAMNPPVPVLDTLDVYESSSRTMNTGTAICTGVSLTSASTCSGTIEHGKTYRFEVQLSTTVADFVVITADFENSIGTGDVLGSIVVGDFDTGCTPDEVDDNVGTDSIEVSVTARGTYPSSGGGKCQIATTDTLATAFWIVTIDTDAVDGTADATFLVSNGSVSDQSTVTTFNVAPGAVAQIDVSGTLYSDEGTTQIDGGSVVVQLRVATATPGVFSTTTDSGSGIWRIDNIEGIDAGIAISAWIDADVNTRAFGLTKASSSVDGANITGFDLYQNRVIAKHEATSGTSTTNADLAFFDNDNDSDIQFTSVAGGLLSVFKDQELHIWDGDTFAPGGAVTIHGNASSTTDGSLHIDNNATLTAGGAISVAGNWDADTGSTFTEGGNTVTFNATTTGKTIAGTLTGSSAFGNVTFNGSGGAWSFSNNASTTDFTITNGGVTAPTLLTVGGNYSNSGDFTDNSGTVFFSGSGI